VNSPCNPRLPLGASPREPGRGLCRASLLFSPCSPDWSHLCLHEPGDEQAHPPLYRWTRLRGRCSTAEGRDRKKVARSDAARVGGASGLSACQKVPPHVMGACSSSDHCFFVRRRRRRALLGSVDAGLLAQVGRSREPPARRQSRKTRHSMRQSRTACADTGLRKQRYSMEGNAESTASDHDTQAMTSTAPPAQERQSSMTRHGHRGAVHVILARAREATRARAPANATLQASLRALRMAVRGTQKGRGVPAIERGILTRARRELRGAGPQAMQAPGGAGTPDALDD
jgi:hypothetical protein